jgi:hypothetical protein
MCECVCVRLQDLAVSVVRPSDPRDMPHTSFGRLPCVPQTDRNSWVILVRTAEEMRHFAYGIADRVSNQRSTQILIICFSEPTSSIR